MTIETMTKLASYTVGATSESSITFSNIPQSYTDLIIKISGRKSNNDYDVDIKLNSTTTGYTGRYIEATGSSVSSGSYTSGTNPWGTAGKTSYTSSVFGDTEFYISNYTSSRYKTISVNATTENNATATVMDLSGWLWSNTSAVTSIDVFTPTGSLVQYSTITIYGIKNMRTAAGNSIKATGGAISFDGTYVVHTFNSSDVFTPTTNLLVDYLVVAGGGGGGGNGGSGAGAGGLRSTVGATGGGGSLESKLSLSATTYAVTIGAGGSGTGSNVGGYPAGVSGNNSSFHTITSIGGARGTGANVSDTVASGGSGGGAAVYNGNGPTTGGAGTANQGYAGGNATNQGTYFQCAGGGGAGGVGGAPSGTTNNIGGLGGAGVTTNISGSSIVYASGGSGYAQTLATTGGGGAYGYPGSPNTGGGGGGYNGSGGSGVVIIRYKA